MPTPMAMVIRNNVDFQVEIVPPTASGCHFFGKRGLRYVTVSVRVACSPLPL
jgi:hypothetical protein